MISYFITIAISLTLLTVAEKAGFEICPDRVDDGAPELIYACMLVPIVNIILTGLIYYNTIHPETFIALKAYVIKKARELYGKC